MALTANHPLLAEVFCPVQTTSIATTPVAAVVVAPCAGIIKRLFAAAGGTTTGTVTVAVSVNGGSDITGGGLTIAAGTGARNNAPQSYSGLGSGAITVAEGDVITFTPSGGTGASIPGSFGAVIKQI